MACHESELPEVLDAPFPPGACCREPATEITNLSGDSRFWSNKFPYKVGDTFKDNINQGLRHCVVMAVADNGDYLYEYEMPNGRTYIRNQDGRPVSRNRMPKWYRDQEATPPVGSNP